MVRSYFAKKRGGASTVLTPMLYKYTVISLLPNLSMTYFRTYTEFLPSSLSDDDISDTPDKWRGLIIIVDFIGPGVDVIKLLEVFPEIS